MAALYKILKRGTRIHHLRSSRISFVAKHFSCSPLRRDSSWVPHIDDQLVNYKEDNDEVEFSENVLDFIEAKAARYFPRHTRVYTDGAKKEVRVGEKRAGVGVFCKDVNDIQGTFRANDGTTSERAESLGVLAALDLISEYENRSPSDRKYLLLTDHADTLKEMGQRKSDDDVINEIKRINEELRKRNVEVVFSWIPGHFGVPGHKHAENLARDLGNPWPERPLPERQGKKMTIPSRGHSPQSASECKINVDGGFNIIQRRYGGRSLTYRDEMLKLEDCIGLLKTWHHARIPRVLTHTHFLHKYEPNKRIGFGVTSRMEESNLDCYYYLEKKEHLDLEDDIVHTIALKVALKAVLSKMEVDEKYERQMREQKMLVLSDKHTGIHNLLFSRQRPDVVDKTKYYINQLKDQYDIDVFFSWYPSPPGLPGNKKADEFASHALYNPTIYSLFRRFGTKENFTVQRHKGDRV